MTHETLHNEIAKLLYVEDRGLYDIMIASIIANSLQLGDPVWMTLIGASSAGKSQLIRPLAMSEDGPVHRIDDLTANTMISGSLGLENSLLGRIGDFGILSMDDLTVLFSKNAEERQAVLSQFRMIYDGRMSKSSGNKKDDMVWQGYMGMIAGSTPSIYRYFNEVADMGERFISYRMKNFDKDKALDFIDQNPYKSKELDEKLCAVFDEFIKGAVAGKTDDLLELDGEVVDEIKKVASHCTHLRTPLHMDERTGLVDEFPEPEMPMRVMKQLRPLAIGLQVVRGEKLTPATMEPVLWVAYSLANDKRRAYLRTAVGLEYYGKEITSRSVSAVTGLHSDIVKRGMDQLQVLGIIELKDEDAHGQKKWRLKHRGLQQIVMRLDTPAESIEMINDTW